MARTGPRDTAPEMALRRELHRRGLRFRVDTPVLADKRRRVDIVFGPTKVAVFVDGCFWHGCPEHGTRPRSNSDWWREKLAANKARDADTDSALHTLGWSVVRAWEHERASEVADRVERQIGVSRAEAQPR